MAFGHRRLAIIDLTSTGAQPMKSGNGRFTITYNGEIYNYQDLRHELLEAGVSFKGTSDTEVLLAGFERWGVKATLQRATGMFALAVWDADHGRLSLARDRLGEKPLYYGRIGSSVVFGSETTALAAHPAFHGTVDRTALALYLRYGCVPAPHCIFEGLRKLLPGQIAEFESPARAPVVSFFWAAREEAARAKTLGPPDDPVEELDRLLRRTVRRSMVSDVPIGVFLSGGIDSSTVAALMQAESERPIHTFTIGFAEASHNEADHAREVARHLGTHHTELRVTPAEAMDVIPKLAEIYHEPFADSSQIPTFLVSKLARAHVTVALSGDGGDEIFGGYERYLAVPTTLRRVARTPRPIRAGLAAFLRALPESSVRGLGQLAAPLARGSLRTRLRGRDLPRQLSRLADLLQAKDPVAARTGPTPIWRNAPLLVVAPSQAHPQEAAPLEPIGGIEETMMLGDTLAYLPDDVLVKVDRASMAVGLESRAPLLSHEVFAAAWRIPLSDKIREGRGKWVLRQVLYRYVPRALVDRPKAGFAVPVGEWLRGPLRAWAEALLAEDRLRADGILDPVPIRKAWSEHLDGKDRQAELWVVLMFQSWLDAHRKAVKLGRD